MRLPELAATHCGSSPKCTTSGSSENTQTGAVVSRRKSRLTTPPSPRATRTVVAFRTRKERAAGIAYRCSISPDGMSTTRRLSSKVRQATRLPPSMPRIPDGGTRFQISDLATLSRVPASLQRVELAMGGLLIAARSDSCKDLWNSEARQRQYLRVCCTGRATASISVLAWAIRGGGRAKADLNRNRDGQEGERWPNS